VIFLRRSELTPLVAVECSMWWVILGLLNELHRFCLNPLRTEFHLNNI
jgi:hypothetical protein